MAEADVVITGTVLTVDDVRPTAEALAVADGRIVAVGDRFEVSELIGAATQTIDLGDGCVMPGFIEAIDAAWQLFADDIVGSLEVSKYADMVVLSADPRTVPPERIADLEVRATFLAGRQVYAQ